MNYLKIEHSDVCNGTGLRCSIWLSGCSHKCPNCFNQESWNPDSGIPFEEAAKQEIFDELAKDYISGITLSGGDPLHEQNLDGVLNLIKEIRLSLPQKNIWLYTGFSFDELQKEYNFHKWTPFNPESDIWLTRWEIIKNVDILVDGQYIDEQRDVTLKFRGSKNQRVIDVQQTLAQNKIVLYCD